MREQDQDLEKVSAGLVTLDHMAHAIGEETEDQNRYYSTPPLQEHVCVMSSLVVCRILGDMAHDIEETDSRLQALVNRVQLATRKAGGECMPYMVMYIYGRLSS